MSLFKAFTANYLRAKELLGIPCFYQGVMRYIIFVALKLYIAYVFEKGETHY